MWLKRFVRLIHFLRIHVHGRWLTLARLLWGTLVIWSLALFIAAIPASLVILPCDIYIIGSVGSSENLAAVGFPVQAYIIFRLIANVLVVLVHIALALVIFTYKAADGMALFVSLMLVVGPTGASCITTGLWESQPAWRLPIALTWDLGFASYYLFLYLFPDGRFVPHWTRWLALGVVIIEILLPFGLWWLLTIYWDAVWLFLLVTGIGAQIYRYRAVSGPVERQQTRWVVLGVTTVGVCYLIDFLLPPSALVEVSRFDTPRLIAIFTRALFSLLYPLCLPLVIGLAILRYRLWDIDIVIRRTLTYTLLSILLALIYLSSVAVLQGLSRVVTGLEQNQVVTVLSTLAIAAVFNPLRRRVQNGIDQRFHRRKYDAGQEVAAFTVACHNEVELVRLTGEFGRVMQTTLQPAQVGLWLKPTLEPKRSHAAVLMRDKGSGAT